MRVVMLLSISGTRNGQAWPARGGEVDLPDDEAEQLIVNGSAEPAAERAVVRQSGERAVARRTPSRKD